MQFLRFQRSIDLRRLATISAVSLASHGILKTVKLVSGGLPVILPNLADHVLSVNFITTPADSAVSLDR